jgi:hypothetical protein
MNTYKLTAQDAHGISALSRLQVLPLLVLRAGAGATPTTVVSPHGFYVDALGFAKNENIQIQATLPSYSGNNSVETRSPNANASGAVYGVFFTTPGNAKVGWATVTATGGTSKNSAQGRVYVTYRAFIRLKSTTVNAGSAAAVLGQGFVANSQVRLVIGLSGGQTVNVTAVTDGNGNFTKWVRIPNTASSGTYTVTAVGVATGFKHYAKLTINAQAPAPKPTATAKPTATSAPKPTATSKPVFHASGFVLPKITLPNQNVTFTGRGYPANSSVTVSVTVDMRGGGNRLISKNVYTDSNGNFTVAFRVPYKAAAGSYNVTASGSGVQATSLLQVLALTAHPSNLNFQWTSLWYHTVRHGTWDEVVIQSTLKTTLGIWLHVIFPSGVRHDYYTNTNGSGYWSVKFSIPSNALSPHSNQAYITMQLWHGKQTTQSFINFTVV